jgi:hypothetical protein
MFPFTHIFFKPFKSHFSSLFPFVFPVLLVTLPMLLSANIAHCFDRSFAWDKNTEPDLAGYYIYYKNSSSGAPYNGTGADEGDSPIKIPFASLNDPEHPEYTIHDLSDTETFYFVATAYDIYNNESDYSNVLCFGSTCVASVQGADESGGGGCFIATAAFGSKFEKQVQLLRRFRDLYLMPHTIGRVFVRVYYRYSPPIADFIADHNTLRIVVRWSLVPLIGLSWILLHFGVAPTLLLLLLLMGSAVWKSYEKIKRF